MAGSHRGSRQSGAKLGDNGGRRSMHACIFCSIISIGRALSIADAAYPSMGIAVEVVMAADRRSPGMAERSDGRIHMGYHVCLLVRRNCSNRNALALFCSQVHSEIRRPLA